MYKRQVDYLGIKVSPGVYFWPDLHLAVWQSLVYNFDRIRWQFCEVSPFSVHLVLDTFDIWHAVIEFLEGGGQRTICDCRRPKMANFDSLVVNSVLEAFKRRSFVIGYNVLGLVERRK